MGRTSLPPWLNGAALNVGESDPYWLDARQKYLYQLLLIVIAVRHGWNDLRDAHDGRISLLGQANEVIVSGFRAV